MHAGGLYGRERGDRGGRWRQAGRQSRRRRAAGDLECRLLLPACRTVDGLEQALIGADVNRGWIGRIANQRLDPEDAQAGVRVRPVPSRVAALEYAIPEGRGIQLRRFRRIDKQEYRNGDGGGDGSPVLPSVSALIDR